MTSIAVKFRPSTVEGKRGVIYYQVVHNRVVRQIKSDYRIYTYEWCTKTHNAKIDDANNQRAKLLRLIRDQVDLEVSKLYRLIKEMNQCDELHHCNDLITQYYKLPKVQTLFGYLNAEISYLRECDKLGTASNHLATYNSFFRFRDGEDLVLENITPELIQQYEMYLRREGVTMNSVSFYMRNLRAAYNKAVEQGILESKNPFKKVYTGVDKTFKQTLSLEEIKRIKEFSNIKNSTCEYARDMFLFSFYTRGMSFVDMANLRKSDIVNGVLCYQRRKKGQPLYIRWEKCMQEIVDKYYIAESEYLLPIINDIAGKPNELNRYKNELFKVNNWLKKLSQQIHLSVTLTMNVARHSWALAAKTKSIPISVISESLGYANEVTTQLYLSSLDGAIVHGANSMILGEVAR